MHLRNLPRARDASHVGKKESTGRVVGDLQLQSLSDQGLHDETGRKCALCASNLSNTLATQAAVAISNNTLALALADGNPK